MPNTLVKGDGATQDVMDEMLQEIEDWRSIVRYDPDMSGFVKPCGFNHSQYMRCLNKYVLTPMEYKEGKWQECAT